MPRLRNLPGNFVQRRRGFRTPQASLEQGRNTGALLADYSVACRAGRAIMPIIRPLGLPLDFSTGRGVRVEDGQIVFVVDNPTQLSRLRNLQTRITQQLLTQGVPITGIDFRLRAHNLKVEEPPANIAIRTPSLVAAAELKAGVETLADADLREQLRALARIMAPTPAELPLALVNTLTEERERLPELTERLQELIAHLPSAPARSIIFSAEEVAGDKTLIAMRERMLARRERRNKLDQIVEATQTFLNETPARIDTLLQCTLSPEIPLPDWMEEALRATSLTLLLGEESPSMQKSLTAPTAQKSAEQIRMEQLAQIAINFSRQIVRCKKTLDTAILELKQEVALVRETQANLSAPFEESSTKNAIASGGTLCDLREALRIRGSTLSQTAKATRTLIEKALHRLPPTDTLVTSDKRVAAEVARVALARAKGEVHPEDHLSADSTRQLLLWSTRDRLEKHLNALNQAITALLDRLAADHKILRAQRSAKRSGTHSLATLASIAGSASALVADFSALREIDRRRTEDEEELSRISAESETLSDSVDILLAGLPDEDYTGESPEKAALEEASVRVDHCIRALNDHLGTRPNPQLIPSQEEVATDTKLAQCRARLLKRLEDYAKHQALISTAAEALTAFRRVLHAPRSGALDASLIEGLKRSLEDVLNKVETARAIVAPMLSPLPTLDVLLGESATQNNIASSKIDKKASPQETTASKPFTSTVAFPQEDFSKDAIHPSGRPASLDMQATVAEAEAMLSGFSSMIALWETQRPSIPDERLIPSEADAAKNLQLKKVRARQLARKARRQEIDALLDAFKSICAHAQVLLQSSEVNPSALTQCLQDLEHRTDQIGELLAKPLLASDTPPS